jgi:hypothetical protein
MRHGVEKNLMHGGKWGNWIIKRRLKKCQRHAIFLWWFVNKMDQDILPFHWWTCTC